MIFREVCIYDDVEEAARNRYFMRGEASRLLEEFLHTNVKEFLTDEASLNFGHYAMIGEHCRVPVFNPDYLVNVFRAASAWHVSGLRVDLATLNDVFRGYNEEAQGTCVADFKDSIANVASEIWDNTGQMDREMENINGD